MYETFAAHEPVARIRPADTVVTKLLDSRSRDETGKLILDGDNVLTASFYVEGAEPGDTLIIKNVLNHIHRVPHPVDDKFWAVVDLILERRVRLAHYVQVHAT